MLSPRKILLIKMRALGDTVLLTASLQQLLRSYPKAEIHVLISENWAPLFKSYPGVKRLWTYKRHRVRTSRAKALARLAFQLRKEKFDCVVNLHASPSSALLSFSTGAPTRAIHFHGHKDKNRYSTVEIPGKGILKPVIERDLDTLRALGLNIPAGTLPEFPKGSFSGKALVSSPSLLSLGLGASRPTKAWPMSSFAKIAIRWCEETGGKVAAFAGHTEKEWLERFEKEVRTSSVSNQIQGFVEPPLEDVAETLKNSKLFLGNDSGLKHLAIALGTHTFTLFGPEDPFEWHPYSQSEHPYFFIPDLPCRKDADPGYPAWCGLQTCTKEGNRCLTEITPEEVFDGMRNSF